MALAAIALAAILIVVWMFSGGKKSDDAPAAAAAPGIVEAAPLEKFTDAEMKAFVDHRRARTARDKAEEAARAAESAWVAARNPPPQN